MRPSGEPASKSKGRGYNHMKALSVTGFMHGVLMTILFFVTMKSPKQTKRPPAENRLIHWATIHSYTDVIMNGATGVLPDLKNTHVIAISE